MVFRARDSDEGRAELYGMIADYITLCRPALGAARGPIPEKVATMLGVLDVVEVECYVEVGDWDQVLGIVKVSYPLCVSGFAIA